MLSDRTNTRLVELQKKKKYNGEPYALKGARTVRRGVEGCPFKDSTLPTLQ